MTKTRHFWTTYPPPHVNVVCERPLKKTEIWNHPSLLPVFLSITFNKLLWFSPWTISMGHFRIVFMEAQQHQQQSFIDKEGVVFALPVLLCTALKKTSTTPPRSQGRQPSMQHPPPICWAAAKTRIFLSQHKQTCSMGALLDISCQARLLHSNTYVWLRHRPDRQTSIQLRSFIQYIVGRV